MNTKALRQKILDLAIHGKLVPQDPNDEPASVLLERIRDEKERLIKEGKIKRPKKSKATSDKPHYENVPFEVPSSWVWCKLHDIIQITNGRSQKYVENVNGKYPIYGSGGIIGKAVDYLCEAGSTIIGRKGTINNPLFVEERFWNIDTAFGMKPMYAISDLYFFYFCQYFDFSKLDKSTAVPSLTQSAIGEVFIPIPPINEQKRITDGISYWLGFIDTLESNLINLQLAIKQTKSKILNLAIHGKLVPQDPTDEPASKLLKRINPKAEIISDNGHYQKLPKGWCMTNIGSLFDAVSAKRVFKSEWKDKGVPFYRAREIVQLSKEGFADKDLFISEKHYAEIKDKYGIPTYGDIMISAVGSIGYTYIVKEDDVFYYKDASVLCLKNTRHWNSKFFSIWLASPFLQEQMYKNSKGTTVDTITLEKIKEYAIPFPPLNEQHCIVAKVEEIFAQLDTIEASL